MGGKGGFWQVLYFPRGRFLFPPGFVFVGVPRQPPGVLLMAVPAQVAEVAVARRVARLAGHVAGLRPVDANAAVVRRAASAALDGGAGEAHVFVMAAARTPMGAFQGALAHVQAPELGALAIKAALEKAGVAPAAVDTCVMGNVLSAGVGQAPARQAALLAGLPTSTCCTTVNKVCSSGLKAVTMCAQAIKLGESRVAVCGGFESMSNAPYLLPNARQGYRMGNQAVSDSMLRDGLWDPLGDRHMGSIAEGTARARGISRERQDAHALRSFERARAAQAKGSFDDEVVGVPGKPAKRGAEAPLVSRDEPPDTADLSRLPSLRPAFAKDGTVTAGNASVIADGAAALVLGDASAPGERVARILAWADAELDPSDFPIAPSSAVKLALARAKLAPSDIDAWEINEAFSAVDIANKELIGLAEDAPHVNADGGGVALGHPIGASGARILVTLLGVLKRRGGRRGVAAICNGGGGSTAVVVELL